MKVKKGDVVIINYILMDENNNVIESSYNSEPLRFRVGAGEVISGLDEGIIGMEVGEEREIIIPPEKAYGYRRDELVIPVPKNVFIERNIEPIVGTYINTRYGRAKIINVDDENVYLDFNHPLAGVTIKVKVKVEKIIREEE